MNSVQRNVSKQLSTGSKQYLFRTLQNETATSQQMYAFKRMFQYFKKNLFSDYELPNCHLGFSRKYKKAYGFYTYYHRTNGEKVFDEIALNPNYLDRTAEQVASTLVHELCHLWQYHFDKPSRSGYHNKRWREMMLQVGLCPSHTGLPRGRQTGQKMSHYPIKEGAFQQAFEEMPREYIIIWESTNINEFVI